jgi:TolB protein
VRRTRWIPLLSSLTLVAGLLLSATPARATFPGARGKIAFSTDIGDNPQIFTVEPDGSDQTQITRDADGHAFAPDWSRDGTKIAFEGDATGNHEIYLMNADGTGRTQLTDDSAFDHFNPRFSPDGSKIAFARCPVPTCAIYVMNINGTGLTRLTSTTWDAFDPEWSPDGTKIAFDSNEDGLVSAVWVMNANGSHQHRLTAPALEAFYPDWSPDGTHLLFSSHCCILHGNVYVMNADGTGLKQLTHVRHAALGGAGLASYSPDGTQIVLASDLKYRNGCCSDLYVMNANGGGLTRIVANQPALLLSDWGASP